MLLRCSWYLREEFPLRKASIRIRTKLFMPVRLPEGTFGISGRGARMRRYWEIEADRIVLECHQCGEMIVLLGYEEDWYKEGSTLFECQCGQKLPGPPELSLS